MPDELILVTPPVHASGRNFYPVVRVSHVRYTSGEWISTTPVAILIEEGESWYYSELGNTAWDANDSILARILKKTDPE